MRLIAFREGEGARGGTESNDSWDRQWFGCFFVFLLRGKYGPLLGHRPAWSDRSLYHSKIRVLFEKKDIGNIIMCLWREPSRRVICRKFMICVNKLCRILHSKIHKLPSPTLSRMQKDVLQDYGAPIFVHYLFQTVLHYTIPPLFFFLRRSRSSWYEYGI